MEIFEVLPIGTDLVVSGMMLYLLLKCQQVNRELMLLIADKNLSRQNEDDD